MSETCFVCGAQHAIEEPAHKKIYEMWNRLGAIEAKVRDLAKPAYTYPTTAGTTATVIPNVTFSVVPAADPVPVAPVAPEAVQEPVPEAEPAPVVPPEQNDPQGV